MQKHEQATIQNKYSGIINVPDLKCSHHYQKCPDWRCWESQRHNLPGSGSLLNAAESKRGSNLNILIMFLESLLNNQLKDLSVFLHVSAHLLNNSSLYKQCYSVFKQRAQIHVSFTSQLLRSRDTSLRFGLQPSPNNNALHAER